MLRITIEDLKYQQFELSLIEEYLSTDEQYYLMLGDIQDKLSACCVKSYEPLVNFA